MKKFIKVFIIVLLVVAVVAGTAFFFFRKIEEKNNTSASIAAITNPKGTSEFYAQLDEMKDLVNSDGTDNRLDIVIETCERLDQYIFALSTYYIDTDTKINNEKIANLTNQLSASKSLMSSMVQEYNIKKESSYFDRHLGANDFYKQACSHIITSANLLKEINNNINVNKDADIKFSMFECYANVAIQTFTSTQVVNSKIVIKDSSNIQIMHKNVEFNGSLVETETSAFGSEIRSFNKYYSDCNKTEFASKLAENISSVNSVEQDSNEKIATYYFKLIYGI